MVRQYLRVSQDASGMGKSPDQQQHENDAAITRQGWAQHPSAPYRDTDRSASRFATREREGFTQLVADLEAGTFSADTLALWESSRGSRRVGEWVTLVELCTEHDIQIWVTTHGRLYDPRNARDRRSILEDAVDAEYEAAKTSERIQRNVRAAAAEGRVHGKNLYGYLRRYGQGPRGPVLEEIVEHPEHGPVVREVFRRAEAGESFYSIAQYLNVEGIPPRRPPRSPGRQHIGWTSVAVKQMLTVPAYAGKRVHRGEIVADATWPALIDFDRWEALQPRISPESRKRTAGDWKAKHLLSGIVRCGVCPSVMRVGKQNRRLAGGERSTYPTYVCSGAEAPVGRGGSHTAMKMEILDELVTDVLLARMARPDFLAELAASRGGDDGERAAVREEIAGYERYLDEVRAQAAEMQRFDLVVDQEARLRPKIVAAQARLDRMADVDPLVVELARSSAPRVLWEDEERFGLAGRRRVIRAVMAPRVMPLGRGGWRGPESNEARIEWGWL